MNKNHNVFIGIVFILIGTLFMISNLGYLNLSWSYIWPLALLIPGVYLHYSFFTGLDRNPGILVPAGILTTYGILFYVNVIFGWRLMAELWPIFLLGISVGLAELYIFGNRDKGLIVPIIILGGLGFIFLSNTVYILNKKYLAPAFLIILGIVILIRDREKRQAHNPKARYSKEDNDTKIRENEQENKYD